METEYASNSKGNTAVTLGAVALGGAVVNGIMNHIRNYASGGGSVTQAANTVAAMELAQANAKIAMLEQNAATRNALTDTLYKLDTRVGKLETETPLLHQILEQKVDSVATMASTGIAQLSATLAGITKCVVPNTSVCPGWGNVTITPTGSGAVVA